MTTVSTTGSSTSTIDQLMTTMNAKSTSSTSGTSSTSSSSSSGTDSVASDTSNFMTLLVAQLQNQDPMNPMDNAQMTSQLAQLQTVTGINNLNTTLSSLSSSYQSSQAVQATSLIGHGVLLDGNSVTLSSGQGVLGVNLGTAADDVKVAISDSSGNVVDTMDLGAQSAGSLPLAWSGTTTDSSGNTTTLPDGKYTFTVTATKSGQALTDATGLSYDSVGSVSTSTTDGVKLYLASKGTASLSDIKQVL
ncbi:MAG TPA: flagellar hook capping FlgD N-terminal domain-containing protein [Telluria sp.]